MGWFLGGLLVVLVAGWLTLLVLMHPQARAQATLTVDGRAVAVEYRYGCKLPKALRAAATTVNETICFRAYPRSYPVAVVGVAPISRALAAHELGHVIDKHRRGTLPYWRRILWDIVTVRDHDQRPSEREAMAIGAALLTSSYPGVDVGTALEGF